MRRTVQTLRSGLVATLLLAGLAGNALAQAAAAPRNPGGGFADPARPALRHAAPDHDVVWRAPAVDTLATVRRRGLLRACVVPVEPMVMHDATGERVGFSIDLSRQLAQDLGVDIEFVPSSWGLVVPDLLDRQCDLVATGLWVTLPRALVVNFSTPTVNEGVYLVAGTAAAAGKAGLAAYNQPGITLAVYAGTPQEALARRVLPNARLLATADDPLQAVLKGQAQAALAPSLTPQALLQAAPGQLVLPLALPLSSTPAAIAVRKGDADFLHFINTWLGLQRDSGWLDERLNHWTTRADWTKP